MSNVEAAPGEIECRPGATAGEILEPRSVPLGGPRAMPVRRTLPQRRRSLIGAWCFVDHYGPHDVASGGAMEVPGHPHTGLQTVSWLFRGAISHRDTTGAAATVRPGELNLMTAGTGIAHSEFSTDEDPVLHGVQLWIALPDRHRFVAPAFERHVPDAVDVDGAAVRVILGTLAGETSPATTYSPLLGAEVTLPPGRRTVLAVDPDFEHGVLLDAGGVTVGGQVVAPGHLAYRPPGASTLELAASGDTRARVLLLGGEPLAEPIVMWWNFVGRSHEEIAGFRAQWQDERSRPHGTGERRFGTFPTTWEHTLPAPTLPGTRLIPRS